MKRRQVGCGQLTPMRKLRVLGRNRRSSPYGLAGIFPRERFGETSERPPGGRRLGLEPAAATIAGGEHQLARLVACWRAMPRSVSATIVVFVGSGRPAARQAAAISTPARPTTYRDRPRPTPLPYGPRALRNSPPSPERLPFLQYEVSLPNGPEVVVNRRSDRRYFRHDTAAVVQRDHRPAHADSMLDL